MFLKIAPKLIVIKLITIYYNRIYYNDYVFNWTTHLLKTNSSLDNIKFNYYGTIVIISTITVCRYQFYHHHFGAVFKRANEKSVF